MMEISAKKNSFEENHLTSSRAAGALENERAELQRKNRELNRKVEELTDDVKMLEETNLDMKSEKSRL
jgi:TolA-binding protein